MKTLLIEEDLKDEKLKRLIEFVSLKSNKISLSRIYYGKLSEKEFDNLQEEFRDIILKEDKKRRENYSKNINSYKDRINNLFSSEREVEEYFNDILEEEMNVYKELDYKDFRLGEYERYKSSLDSFIESKFTRNTFVTRGPVFEVSYFKLDEDIIKEILNLKSLFNFPLYIEDIPFEDLTFYKDNKVILGICSHEKFANIILKNEDYEEFLKLNINYKI